MDIQEIHSAHRVALLDLDVEFAAHERLPPVVREALATSPVKISAQDAAEALAFGLSPAAVVRLILEGEARERDAFARLYAGRYGFPFPHVAAEASVLRDAWPAGTARPRALPLP